MDAWIWIVIALAVIVARGACSVALGARKRRTSHLQGRFGPEYDRAVERDRRSSRGREGVARPASCGTTTSTSGRSRQTARERYAEEWQRVQARFVDDPEGAVGAADRARPAGDARAGLSDATTTSSDERPTSRWTTRMSSRTTERVTASGTATAGLTATARPRISARRWCIPPALRRVARGRATSSRRSLAMDDQRPRQKRDAVATEDRRRDGATRATAATASRQPTRQGGDDVDADHRTRAALRRRGRGAIPHRAGRRFRLRSSTNRARP